MKLFKKALAAASAALVIYAWYRRAERDGQVSLAEIVDLIALVRSKYNGRLLIAPEVHALINMPGQVPQVKEALSDLLGASLENLAHLAPDLIRSGQQPH